jgi:hypothetical protein
MEVMGGRLRAVTVAVVLVAVVLVAVVLVVTTVVVAPLVPRPTPDGPAVSATSSPTLAVEKSPPPQPRPEPDPEPEPAPRDTGPTRDEVTYDVAALPIVDVFAIRPDLPVDDDPDGEFTGVSAHPRGEGAPVFPEPGSPPVAHLPPELQFGGTTVPVVEHHEHWLRVLLPGRQAPPSTGDPGQLTGWVRTADVDLVEQAARIEVDLSDRTVDVVTGEERERVATDFAWGTTSTPTPVGRTFVMTTRSEPSFAYTRGHPIIYLGIQSPTLDRFGGVSVAVTAFHYHDNRSGAVSNGCIRLAAGAIHRLAELPEGSPVTIRA